MTTPTPSPIAAGTDIGGNAVASGTDASQGSAYVLQVYCQTVLQTPSLVPPTLPGMPTDPKLAAQIAADLATAQTHASYYLQTLNPLLFGLSAQVVGYANQWTAMFNQLVTDAGNINDPTSRSDFIEGINLLIKKANIGKGKSTQAATALSSFSTDKLSPDIAAFTADYNDVCAIYGTGSLEEQQLQQAINACNKGMTTDLIAVSFSAVGLVVGGAAVLIGLAGVVESAGATTVLIVGGFAVAAGSAVAGTVAMTDWAKENRALATATKSLTAAQAICASTQQTMSNIESLGKAHYFTPSVSPMSAA